MSDWNAAVTEGKERRASRYKKPEREEVSGILQRKGNVVLQIHVHGSVRRSGDDILGKNWETERLHCVDYMTEKCRF